MIAQMAVLAHALTAVPALVNPIVALVVVVDAKGLAPLIAKDPEKVAEVTAKAFAPNPVDYNLNTY